MFEIEALEDEMGSRAEEKILEEFRLGKQTMREKIIELEAENALLRAEAKINCPAVTGNPYEKDYQKRIMELDAQVALVHSDVKLLTSAEVTDCLSEMQDVVKSTKGIAGRILSQLDAKPLAVVSCRGFSVLTRPNNMRELRVESMDDNLLDGLLRDCTLIVHTEEVES